MDAETLDDQRQACEEILHVRMHEALMEITKRMGHIGLSKHPDAKKWFSVIDREVTAILDDLVAESVDREKAVMDECVELLQKAEKYCKSLGLPMEAHGANEERNLIEEKILLKKRLDEYEIMLQKNQSEIKILQKRNLAVSKAINEDPLLFEKDLIPTGDKCKDLVVEIEKRETKRYEREEKLIKTKEDILKLMEEFQIRPTTEFQSNIIQNTVDSFVFSEENMKLLEYFHYYVTTESNSLLEKVAEARLKVRSIWDILLEDSQHCAEFIKNHPGSSQATLEAFRNELSRCEEQRRNNVGLFIEKRRTEIAALWNKCHLSTEERNAFKYSDCIFYNEDLLEIHDREFERLQQLYDEKKAILQLVEEHNKLWKKLEELEENSNNPSRLMNRGCTLLKEEKERNALRRHLPKIYEEIMQLVNTYKETNGVHICSYGKPVEDIIEEKYSNRIEEKQQKLSARKLKNTEVTPGRSTTLARSMKLTPDMKSTAKRRILSPRNATTSKKMRVVAARKRDIQKLPQLRLNDIKLDISNRSANKRKRLRKSRRLSDLLNQKGDVEYNEFSDQLCKSNLRSTLLVSPDTLAVPLDKTPPKPSGSKSPSVTPRNKSAKKLALGSSKTIIL